MARAASVVSWFLGINYSVWQEGLSDRPRAADNRRSLSRRSGAVGRRIAVAPDGLSLRFIDVPCLPDDDDFKCRFGSLDDLAMHPLIRVYLQPPAASLDLLA